jgi:glycosyltransferase involved in cell wall biosynthesis
MNILYLNANQRNKLSHAAGYATHMAKTIKGFEAAGHKVIKLLAGETQQAETASKTYKSLSGYLPGVCARMIRDTYEVVHDHNLFRKWLAVAARQEIHFVYERMNQLHTCGLRLARRLGVPFVIEINDPMRQTVTVDLSPLMKRYAVHLEDRLVRESDFVVLGSQELKKSYIRHGWPADKFLVLYPTADLQMFRPTSGAGALKPKLGLVGKTVVGLVAGDTSAGWRRTDLFLDALSSLARKQPHLAAMVVGDGKPPASFESNSAKLPIIFTGKVPYAEVPTYIDAMDICVIPNATWYGSPTKLFEYGAMAKTIIAPHYPPIEEILEDGISGLLFERENPADLITKIALAAGNPQLRQQLGQGILAKIKKNYNWELNTDAVINAVRKQSLTGADGRQLQRKPTVELSPHTY